MFRRKGDNLEVEVPITVAEAIRGRRRRGADAARHQEAARAAAGTKHGTVQRLRGEGPQRLSDRARGDIHYRFVIDVPKDLSPSRRRPSTGCRR